MHNVDPRHGPVVGFATRTFGRAPVCEQQAEARRQRHTVGMAPEATGSAQEPRWWGNHLGEIRWQLDAARLLAHPVLRGRGIPRGDGRSVLLLPGFLAGDYTLATMGIWLRRIGYRPRRVGFLANVDCSERSMRAVEARAEALVEEHGRRVAVVGHSRGAHQAKVLAVRRPELVSHVIGLGGGLSR